MNTVIKIDNNIDHKSRYNFSQVQGVRVTNVPFKIQVCIICLLNFGLILLI